MDQDGPKEESFVAWLLDALEHFVLWPLLVGALIWGGLILIGELQ